MIIDFIRYYVPFTNSEINANFKQDLLTISNSVIPMGLREAILEDVKQQGIEQGIEQGKLEVTLNLWSTQEFSIEKMAMLVDLSIERVAELILNHLKAGGMTEEKAQGMLQIHQEKFSN